MKRFFKFRILLLLLLVLSTFHIVNEENHTSKATIEVNASNEEELVVCGYPVGIYLKYDGVLVAKVGTFKNSSSMLVSPSRGKLNQGDIIIKFNGQDIEDKMEFTKLVEENGCNDAILLVRRNNEDIEVKVTPQNDANNSAKLGIWVRDDAQGIGTITYITPEGDFGALGHGINDIDTGSIIPIRYGNLYEASIIDIKKGNNGSPGEFIGSINYNKQYKLGSISVNSVLGVYGTFDEMPESNDQCEIGNKYDIKCKTASIVSYVDGTRKEYEIEIINVDLSRDNINKGIEFRVTDPELLEITNGIVQGMSGSPILQDGKIIGAVTHVLVNDPARGYGIFIENMLEH